MSEEPPLSSARHRARALVARSKYFFDANRFEEALRAYDDALAHDPESPNALLGKANALLMLKRSSEALAVCDGLLARDPASAAAFTTKASVLHRMGRPREALELYRRGVELAPGSFGAHYDVGCYWALEGDAARCAEYLRKALALEPKRNAKAGTDPDFARHRDEPWFQELVAFKS